MNKPKIVSVIIPNYNYADFIIERINSVINQTYKKIYQCWNGYNHGYIFLSYDKIYERKQHAPCIKTTTV